MYKLVIAFFLLLASKPLTIFTIQFYKNSSLILSRSHPSFQVRLVAAVDDGTEAKTEDCWIVRCFLLGVVERAMYCAISFCDSVDISSTLSCSLASFLTLIGDEDVVFFLD